MTAESVEDRVALLVEGILDEKGLELVLVEYVGSGRSSTLRLFIDRGEGYSEGPGGVTIDECSSVSRELARILDVEDIIRGSYSLEVSSPGLDRPLTKESDYTKYAGRVVNIKTRNPLEGRRKFKGTLKGLEDGKVIITDSEDSTFELELSNIEKAKLEVVL